MKLNRELLLLLIFAIVITLICGHVEEQSEEIKRQQDRAEYYSEEIIKQQVEIWSLKDYIQKHNIEKREGGF